MSGVVRSMTGYGSASLESALLQAEVAARSLNHRFLDLAIHVPRRLAHLEPGVKALVQGRLSRGRVEVTLRATPRGESADTVSASREVVAGLVQSLRRLKQEFSLEGDVSVSDVARFPGALEPLQGPDGLDQERSRAVLGLVEQALEGLDRMRQDEGRGLAAELVAGLARIEAAAGRVEAVSLSEKAARREALVERARELCGELGLDDARLYQEVVRLVEKHDVSEELQRLRSHVDQARGVLAAGGPCGKRLDFLVQELMREANTIGSKAGSAPLLRELVELKAEIERLREQVQNVE